MKRKSKWKTITVLKENSEQIKYDLGDSGELPKKLFPEHRKSRIKDYKNTLGDRPNFFGNYKDPPNKIVHTNIDQMIPNPITKENIKNDQKKAEDKTTDTNVTSSALPDLDVNQEDQFDFQISCPFDYHETFDFFEENNDWPGT